jgi:AhpD family alkylhydroperoxidase
MRRPLKRQRKKSHCEGGIVMSDARLLAEWFPEFAEHLDKMDETYKEMRTIDEKTYQFICFALAIKARSKPCLLKHFMGALEAGATVKELAYIMGLTFREAAGGDDCWTHDALGDYKALIAEGLKSSECCKR